MPVMEIIRHKAFTVVRKTAKSAKVSCHESFMVYGMQHRKIINVIMFLSHIFNWLGSNSFHRISVSVHPHMLKDEVGQIL